jgi:PAS domain S-box-containing protein
MKEKAPTKRQLIAEIEELRRRLEEAEDTLQAIRNGEVDALLVEGPQGEQVFTLRGADYQYRVIVENMDEGAAMLDSGGSILYCNKRLAHMLKRPFEKLIRSPFIDFVNIRDHAKFKSMLAESQLEDARMETVLKAADETAIPVHLSANDVSFEGVQQICVIATDLSDIIAAEKKYREIVETSQEGIGTIDAGANVTFVNSRLAEMLCYDIDDVLGRSVYEFVYAPDIPEARNRFQRQKEGERQQFDIRLKKKDGSFIWVLISARALYDEYGNFAGVLGMMMDVTARKEAEQQITKAKEELEFRVAERTSQLEAAYKDLESFSYSVSHDLRAPVRIIGGLSDALLRDYSEQLDEDGKKLLNSIIGNTKRMDELIKAVLDLSRISSREVSMSEINMQKAASLVADDLRKLFPERKINVVSFCC